MRRCVYGHENGDHHLSCTECGVRLAPPAPAAGVPPAGPSRPVLFAVAVVAVVALLALVAVVLGGLEEDRSGSGHSAVDPSGPSGPTEPPATRPQLIGQLPPAVLDGALTAPLRFQVVPGNEGGPPGVMLEQLDPTTLRQSQVVFADPPARDLMSRPHLSVPDPTAPPVEYGVIPVRGGGIVSWEVGGELVVGMLDVSEGHPVELLVGPPDLGVALDADRRTLLLADHSVPGTRCSVAPLTAGGGGSEVVERFRGVSCDFGANGMVVGREEEGGPFQIFGTDGELIREIDAADGLSDLELGAKGIWAVGSGAGLDLHDVRSGRAIVQSPDGSKALDMIDGSAFLYAHPEGAGYGLSIVDGAGAERPLLTGAGVWGQLLADGDTVLAAKRDAGRVEIRRISLARGSQEVVLAGDGLELAVLPGDEPRILAWAPGADAYWLGPASGELRPGRVPGGEPINGGVFADVATGEVFLGVGVGTNGDASRLVRHAEGEARVIDCGRYCWPMATGGGWMLATRVSDKGRIELVLVEGEQILLVDALSESPFSPQVLGEHLAYCVSLNPGLPEGGVVAPAQERRLNVFLGAPERLDGRACISQSAAGSPPVQEVSGSAAGRWMGET